MNTHDRHNRTTTLQLILCACLILVLSACSSNDHTAATADTVTEIPQAILKLALNTTDGHLLAWYTIDPEKGGTPTSMKVNADTVSASISGLSRTTHTVLIEFEFTDGVDTITLATVSTTVDLSAGDASLTFADADYVTIDPNTDTYDKDNDGICNLDEIINGLPPLVPIDKDLAGLSITPDSASIDLGLTQALAATATYSDNTTVSVNHSVTWNSSDDAVATVSANGIVNSVTTGNATITASFSGLPASSVITVGDKVITGLSVTPDSASIDPGKTQALTATATYTFGDPENVTSSSTWISSDNTVATVDSNGVVTSVAKGIATITASFKDQTASSVITVDIVISNCVLDISKIGECYL